MALDRDLNVRPALISAYDAIDSLQSQLFFSAGDSYQITYCGIAGATRAASGTTFIEFVIPCPRIVTAARFTISGNIQIKAAGSTTTYTLPNDNVTVNTAVYNNGVLRVWLNFATLPQGVTANNAVGLILQSFRVTFS